MVYSGTTGKIAGHIRDAENRDPLPGANILIEGTSMGTAVGLDGSYSLINVPPGRYNVRISMMGYKAHIVENVRVMIDLTTTVDADLEITVIDGETVTITAGRPLIQKDITSSLTSVGSQEIEMLPAQSVGGLLEIQAGVINYGGIHIRGGRSGEVAYWIDGVAVTEAMYGGQGIVVENSAIEELQVVSGTFNAEYGQAMSGIVNIITKEGGSDYSGQIKGYVGDYYSPSDLYRVLKTAKVTQAEDGSLVEHAEYENPLKGFNPSYNAEASLSGPVPFTDNKLTFFTNARYFFDEGFHYGKNWFTPQSLPGDSALVPLNPYDRLTMQGKLTWHPMSNLKISYNLLREDWNRDRMYWRTYKYSPYSIPTEFGKSTTQILSINQVLSRETFFEIRVNRYESERRQYLYEDPSATPHWMATVTDDDGNVNTLDLDTDEGQAGLRNAQVNQWAYEFYVDPADQDGYMHQDSLNSPAQYSFQRGGTDLNHQYRNTAYWVGKLDFVSQLTQNHQMKLGGEFRLYDIRLNNYVLQSKRDDMGNTIEPFQPAIPDIATIYHDDYRRKPREFSAYVQDKMEYFDLIINLGVRFDYFDANHVVPADPTDPNIYNPFKPEHRYRDWVDPPDDLSYAERQRYEDNFEEYDPEERRAFMHKKVSAKTQISPRLGVAYPITDKGVIHFSYGHFFQIPEFQFLYNVPDFKLASGNSNILGNADLDAQKTVQYEIGVSQQLRDDIGADLTIFYRDIRDWVGTSPVQKTYLPSVSYVTYKNEDYSNVMGVNLKLEKRVMSNFGGRIDYSYQVAAGTYSNPTDAFYSLQNNEEPRRNLIPLNWDQRHTLSAQIMGKLSSWTLTFLGRYNTGTPYTPTFATAEAVGSTNYTGLTTNSARKPAIHRYDMYLTKAFDLKSFQLVAFLYVYNIFDQRQQTNVYSDTGTADYTTDPIIENVAPVLNRVGTVEDLYTRPDYYIAPRQLQLGLALEF